MIPRVVIPKLRHCLREHTAYVRFDWIASGEEVRGYDNNILESHSAVCFLGMNVRGFSII